MKRLTTSIIVSILILGLATLWWQKGTAALNPNDKKSVIFVIAPGQGIREIANNLRKEGLINDPIVFFLLVKKLGIDNKIQAGDFRLSPSMSADEVAQTLTHGTLDVWITIPEGKRAAEIADILKEKLPTYKTTWKQELEKHEGYLFPDTYLIPKDADITLVVSIMNKNFENKFSDINTNNTRFTQEEIVTIASLIEREAKYAEDRPLVASVIINRLTIGMKLDIDATIQYALGYQPQQKTWWKRSLTKEDIAFSSPYNTYLNPGLPPTPIANPGLSSLRAVVNPVKTKYLYYISDSSGRNHYAETYEQHNANIKKYGF